MEENAERFVCHLCDANFKSLRNHAHHQMLHANDNKFVFCCGLPGCLLDFATFQNLSSHISKCHKDYGKKCGEKEIGVKCSLCDKLLGSMADLCRHMKDEHIRKGAQDVMCPLGDCVRSTPLTSESIYSKHLSQHHKGWQELPLPNVPEAVVDIQDEANEENYNNEDNDADIFYDADDTFHFQEDDVFSFIGKFYLMMETECFLPVTSIDKISQSLTILSELIQSNMKRKMVVKLQSIGVSEVNIESVVTELAYSNLLYVSHRKDLRGPCFTSDHLRNKFFESQFGSNLPQSVPLSDDPLDPHPYQFVPPRDTIESLIKDPSVQEEIEKSFERFAVSDANAEKGIYTDYFDGSVIRDRKLPVKRIDIIMFQDGFAPTTMMTTVRQRHNTLGAYISLGNIRPWRRTKLKAMQLVLLVLEKDVKIYRKECFQKLFEHLKELESNGVQFKGEKIPVYLQIIVGDNKGSHFIGGFVECFRAHYFCRFCPILLADFTEDPLLVLDYRTNDDYKRSAEIVMERNINNDKGVKEISVFNGLDNFSVCDPSLPPCLGHDLFLGAADKDMKSIIKQFVGDGLFTIQFLNKRIDSFKYTSTDLRNKPAPVREDGEKLGGSAVQNWMLIRLFIFIIGDKIEEDNIYWQLYLLLKKVCEYVCAPVITERQIEELDALVLTYLDRRQIIPNRYTPKHHYLRHYADLIRKFGPLIHVWGMRFEQRHQIFKRIAKACNNFINLLYTMATRHQLHFTYESQGRRFSASMECKPVQLKPGIFPPEIFDFLSAETDLTNAETTNVIKINGLQYRENEWLILSSTASHLKIGLIKGIIIQNTKVMFVLKVMKAFHNDNRGVFEINEDVSELSYVEFDSFLYPSPVSVYEYSDKLCISLKNTIPPS